MDSNIVLNKVSIIERCLKRIREEYDHNPEHLKNYTKQDSIILNLQRACEASIDLAMHIVRVKKIGIPQVSRDAFNMLLNENIISKSIADNLQSMVGFRNIAVHDYQQINLTILQSIIENHLQDFEGYVNEVMEILKKD
ncbi:DUF86 domain-containing protein [Bacillus tianshenii]|nr:DUF86 domain-containing protein [Bacillus tianshenii]